MTLSLDQALLLFLALFALYSPIAALSSYLPVVSSFSPAAQLRLALGLFFNVAVIVLISIWVGEPLLELLGISTAALSATGGIALLYAGIPLMRGIGEDAVRDEAGSDQAGSDQAGSDKAAGSVKAGGSGPGTVAAPKSEDWRAVLAMPLTFPLTIGGATVGLLVAFRAAAENTGAVIGLSLAGLAYAAVTGITVYLAGHLNRRVSASARMILDRIAGILLVAIATILLASGGTRLVVDVLNTLNN